VTTLLTRLVSRDRPIDRADWHGFFDRLADRHLTRGEGAALLASLSTAMPDDDTLHALFDCLDERRGDPGVTFPDAVNIVGTGGGPRTLNVSTAAAIVAASIGVRVIKTGSKAYTSKFGSFDLLEALGVKLTGDFQQTGERLARHGVAFAGSFVYPAEIGMLASQIVPLDLRTVGTFVNRVGPFLAAMPVGAQLTGFSDDRMLPALRLLADRVRDRRVWLCGNGFHADELISCTDNVVYPNSGESFTLRVGSAAPAEGSLEELRPWADPVEQFLAVLAGDAPAAAVHSVCLNAAAMGVLSGRFTEWDTAFAAALDAVRGGAASELLARVRAGDSAAVHV
jgi:anthranilate phosphoribosyltransferase